MKDNGILVMGFLFAWEACKGSGNTVTVLITVQRKALTQLSLPGLMAAGCAGQGQQVWQSCASCELGAACWEKCAESSVLHRWVTHQDPAMDLHCGLAPRNTKLAA